MVGKDVTAAGFTPLAITIRSLVVGADIVRTLCDFYRVGLPQAKAVDRARRPVTARTAMTVSHRGWVSSDRELDCTTKATPFVGTHS